MSTSPFSDDTISGGSRSGAPRPNPMDPINNVASTAAVDTKDLILKYGALTCRFRFASKYERVQNCRKFLFLYSFLYSKGYSCNALRSFRSCSVFSDDVDAESLNSLPPTRTEVQYCTRTRTGQVSRDHIQYSYEYGGT